MAEEDVKEGFAQVLKQCSVFYLRYSAILMARRLSAR
jgi:hypothetical protein